MHGSELQRVTAVTSSISCASGLQDISFPDIRMLCLMCILVCPAPPRTDLTEFGTWCCVQFAILHSKFAFHHCVQVAHLILNQDWQCTYNITLGRVRATCCSGKARMCVSSLNYLACNAHAQYGHPLPSPFCIVSTFSSKRHNIRKKKKVIEHKACVSSFCTILVWSIFHLKKNWARCDRKCILVLM